MAENTRENGLIITWKAWEFIHGKMAGDTRVNIKMIKSMGMDSIHGLTLDNIKECGLEESNMG